MELPNGYVMKTTFWSDFGIADAFGKAAIKDTYKRCFEGWKHSIEYMTELAIALNYKIWQWYEKDEDVARIYDELWKSCEEYIFDNFNEEEISYYLKITD